MYTRIAESHMSTRRLHVHVRVHVHVHVHVYVYAHVYRGDHQATDVLVGVSRSEKALSS